MHGEVKSLFSPANYFKYWVLRFVINTIDLKFVVNF